MEARKAALIDAIDDGRSKLNAFRGALAAKRNTIGPAPVKTEWVSPLPKTGPGSSADVAPPKGADADGDDNGVAREQDQQRREGEVGGG